MGPVCRCLSKHGRGVWFFRLLLFGTCFVLRAARVADRVQPSLSAGNILQLNRGIRVPFGRAVHLSPTEDLKINVRGKDRCQVMVVQNDPLSQRAGSLYPQTFPCKFGRREVVYTHYGSRSPGEDRVRLQIRYDSKKQTFIIPFTLEVTILFIQLEIVTRNIPLIVPKVGGISNPIDSKNLHFKYERRKFKCRVSLRTDSRSLPRYGRILSGRKEARRSLTSKVCDKFLHSGIRYQHTASAVESARKDYIPMTVDLIDHNGDIVKREHFHMMVRVRGGKENSPPSPGFTSLLLMEVNQFVMTAVTPTILAAEDKETPAGQLIFNITRPLSVGEGSIVSTDDQYQSLASFTQKDISDLKIAYKPPSSDSNVRRHIQLELQVVDTDGATSDPFLLMIVVKPMNTLAPVVTKNTGIQMLEGESRPLVSMQNLKISDEDNLKDVTLSVINGLRHGELKSHGVRQRTFTPADLDAGVIVYEHDGSDTYSDNIIFKLTDGKHNVEFLFPVTIYPVDDQAPVVDVNMGVMIREKDTVAMTPFVLSATDVDTDDLTVIYILEPPFSSEGQVIIRSKERPNDPALWLLRGAVYEKPVQEWTQEDLVHGRIFYRHSGKHHSSAVFDKLWFRVKDRNDPPNQSKVHSFSVKILPIDDHPPYLYPQTQLNQTVREFKVVPIGKRHLRYTDRDSEDRLLKYTVTRTPYDTDNNTPFAAGIIVLCQDPENQVNIFTQAMVNHHKICYKPPGGKFRMVGRLIQFEFNVTDTSNNTLDGQRFTLYLKPVNNKPPSVKNVGATVQRYGAQVITPQMLDVSDPDTTVDLVKFKVTQLPRHGKLIYNGNDMHINQEFTRLDIHTGRISYKNTKQGSDDDFRLYITDGFHHIGTTFKIKVQSPDREHPGKVFPPGSVCRQIEVQEGSSQKLTAAQLPTNPKSRLTFLLKVFPLEGMILRDGRRVRSFTNQDILRDQVEYRHYGREVGKNVKTDSFNLTLSRSSDDWVLDGVHINDIQFKVKIVPVDNRSPRIIKGNVFSVIEGKKGTISARHLRIVDIDSEDQSVVCTVVRQADKGYLENISPPPGSEKPRIGIPISAFTAADLRQQNINYVQSVHAGVEPREDMFTIQCSDGANTSPNEIFSVMIKPRNDETPEVFVREFVAQEGKSLFIDMPILYAVDKDEPADKIIFILTHPVPQGKLYKQLPTGSFPITNFTLDDVKAGSRILYEHNDQEPDTQKHVLKFKVTDGLHQVQKSVPIMILPVDDETPRLTINNGLEVDVGKSKTITNSDLKATDLDSMDSSISFILRRAPSYGFLQRKIGLHISNITRGMNFTQWEIDAGYIQYMHTGRGGIRDLVKFDVTDGINPLIDRYFYVSIEGLDMFYPEVMNQGVNLPEGGHVILNTGILSTTDQDTPDENLEFTITRAPAKGHLETSDRPGVPISRFTQLDLAGNKIRYVHTSSDEIKMDSFEFEVTDGYNPVFRTFRISISAVDNKKPILMFEKLRVKEGGTKLITPFELKAVDQDTKDHKVKFFISKMPKHGTLKRRGRRIRHGFNMNDLKENLITYNHDGSETKVDSFTLTVTDGTHNNFFVYPDTTKTTRTPQTIIIEVVPVDNSYPQIVVNKGTSSLYVLEGGRIGLLLTNKALQATDKDSPDEDLIYKITEPAQHGYLINKLLGGKKVTSWTQGDVDKMVLQYILKDGIKVTSDSFKFKVTDRGGNVLDKQMFRLQWCWISFESPSVEVHESSQRLQLKIVRHGFLGETSFVKLVENLNAPGVTVKDGLAKAGEDYRKRYAHQVQFSPGETEKLWNLRITDDNKFENRETFTVELSEPVTAVLESPTVAMVTILDAEDESSVFLAAEQFMVEEGVGKFQVPLHRTGDLSGEFFLVCFTVSGTAKGTVARSVSSFSDYITRQQDYHSRIRFDRNEAKSYCPVTIIDDTQAEPDESFTVLLSNPMGGKLGLNRTTVTILADTTDEASIYFDTASYEVDESEREVEVKVMRRGRDLNKTASVTVRSRRTNPMLAEAGLDYAPINKLLEFKPGETMKKLTVAILDDLGQPKLEGPESFLLVLRMPSGAGLAEPSKTMITINDSVSDLPRMEFKEPVYVGYENDGKIVTTIHRTGDTGHISSVRCYTRQATAQVMVDFMERPNTEDSRTTFLPGEVDKACTVLLMGDGIHEPEEEFRLVLGSPESPTAGKAMLGKQSQATLKIKDVGDKSEIKFERPKWTVKEPQLARKVQVLKIPIVRVGDLSKPSVVRVHTRDGSARAGHDYRGFSKEVKFGFNISRQYVEVDVLYDDVKETREFFTIHIRPDRHMRSEVKSNKATVYVEDRDKPAAVTFPTRPVVVSLRDYDRAKSAAVNPAPGYPLVCITACDPKHPEYSKTSSLCRREGINNTLTRYSWRVAASRDKESATSFLHDVEANTVFTNTKRITLDSIYFGPGSRVRCGARAVKSDKDVGLELFSPVVTIDAQSGVCMPRVKGAVGAEPFTARLRYTGPSDKEHPNMIKVSVTVPHRDGMFPVISTHRPSNFEFILSASALRVGQHKCSNIIDYNERDTKSGFITKDTRSLGRTGQMEPYWYSSELRSDPTLRFYRNLDMNACVWEFVSYYDMTELINICGAKINTDGQVRNLKQSLVSLTVPLYVSYVYHNPSIPGRWQNYDLQSNLRLTFVYDTAILWKKGIEASQSPRLQGSIHPTSMRIDQNGRLVVSFRTEARFRGQFVLSHPGTSFQSKVTSAAQPSLTFTLTQLRSERTYSQPKQTWQFTSNMAIRDYSGSYKVALIPCTTAKGQRYSQPITCNPADPITFDLPIRFQQVSDPVPEEFSLKTQFHLLKKRSLWLSDGSKGFGQGSDTTFSPGDTIRGRLMVDPVQNLGQSFRISLEKVFLCAGKDGYIPKYNPANREYGCLARSPNLLHALKILDKGAPMTVDASFKGQDFKAMFAQDDPRGDALVKQAGSDGFRLASKPLFQVDESRRWFIHTVYTITSRRRLHKLRRQRDLHGLQHSISAASQSEFVRQIRSTKVIRKIGQSGLGTNMARISLNYSIKSAAAAPSIGGKVELGSSTAKHTTLPMMPLVAGISVFVLLLVVIIIVVVLRKRRKSAYPPACYADTLTVPTGQGASQVVHTTYSHDTDQSEI